MLDFIQNLLITIGSFVFVLFVLMVLHELGHYLTGRLFKFKIVEFALGLPPRLYSIMRNGVRWSINAIPVLAYVQFAGEDGVLDENGEDNDPDHFVNKPAWQRIIVLLAGSTTHIVLSVILFFALSLSMGVAHDTGQFPYVYSVLEDSPADKAGLQLEDIVIAVDGNRITTSDQFQQLSNSQAGVETVYTVLREDEIIDVAITPRSNPPAGEGALGIQVGSSYTLEWYNIPQALSFSVVQVKETILESFEVVGALVQNLTRGKLSEDIGGPVAIAAISGEFARNDGLIGLLFLMAILAANLAVINLLPFPGLDGGRIIFVAAEWIRGKKISLRIEAYAHTAGLALLLLFLLAVSYRDILRLFT